MMKIAKADTKKLFGFCIYIRTLVFINEKFCPLDDEINDDKEGAINYIGLINDVPVATARFRLSNTTAKIERVAVVKANRGHGFGKAIILYLIEQIKAIDTIDNIVISVREHLIPFYANLGFKVNIKDGTQRNSNILTEMHLSIRNDLPA